MRNSNYKPTETIRVSVEQPQGFPVEDIKTYLNLENKNRSLGKQENSEQIRARRNLARAVGCADAEIKVEGQELIITLL